MAGTFGRGMPGTFGSHGTFGRWVPGANGSGKVETKKTRRGISTYPPSPGPAPWPHCVGGGRHSLLRGRAKKIRGKTCGVGERTTAWLEREGKACALRGQLRGGWVKRAADTLRTLVEREGGTVFTGRVPPVIWEMGENHRRVTVSSLPVSYTHLTLPTICSV